jgi:hypothetical protein
MNLNKILQKHAIREKDDKFVSQSTSTTKNTLEVYFEDIEDKIIEKIRKADLVFGCIAWLTNEKILKEMEKKHCVIVVQEEDFLRPDINFDGDKQKWKNKIFELYKQLDGHELQFIIKDINYFRWVNTGVRRFGFINKDKSPAFPRMHNKFIICAKYNTEDHNTTMTFNEVITGSYNYTYNSTNSIENIMCVKDEKIVNAYFENFKDILVCSVPLDWSAEWKPSPDDLRYGS